MIKAKYVQWCVVRPALLEDVREYVVQVEPLALEQLGAVRLVNVLEWAERVARTWRKLGGIGVEELSGPWRS